MRFHFGVSKRIKPSKLLYWLGLGFLALLGFFGLTDHAFAQTIYDGTSTDLHSYIVNYEMNIYQKQRGSIATTNKNFSWSYDRNSGSYLSTFYDNAWLIPSGSYDTRTYFTNYNWTLSTNMCSAVNGSKSMDYYFYVNTYSETQWNTMFANNGLFPGPYTATDLASFYIEPIYSSGGDGPPVQYACNIENITGNDYRYRVLCSGIPVENITGYKIYYYNNFWYEAQNQPNALYGGTNQGEQPLFVRVMDATVDYYCSDVAPIGPDEPLFPDDIIGSSNININQGSSGGVAFDTNGSMDYSYIELAYPNTLTQFIEFPLYIANAFINNHDTCVPITIDFSSITRRWGGDYYYLTLPCLGTTIYNIFNVPIFGESVSLYTLIDMLIAFVLLYMLATRMVILINMLMSGEDMVGYLYSGTETSSVDSSTGVVSKRRRRY